MGSGGLELGLVARLWRWIDVAVSRGHGKLVDAFPFDHLASEFSRDREVPSAPSMEAAGHG
jgi:hypothetical protein